MCKIVIMPCLYSNNIKRFSTILAQYGCVIKKVIYKCFVKVFKKAQKNN